MPMDGFHLAQVELERLQRATRKGAPDTFGAAGYIALLRRLRAQSLGEIVYAPAFLRELEEPIAGAIPVFSGTSLVITEGSYLLLDGPWAPVRAELDECWFVDPDEDKRLAACPPYEIRSVARSGWRVDRQHGRSECAPCSSDTREG